MIHVIEGSLLRWTIILSTLVMSSVLAACTAQSPAPPPVKASKATDLVRFLAVGRQGYGDWATKQVATSMEHVAGQYGDINFTLLLGDNFYPEGVESTTDLQWQDKFEELYEGAYQRGMPFYAILGNHDHQGNFNAQLDYSAQKLGSGRWRMDAPFHFIDIGEVEGRPLVRIAFIDSVRLHGIGTYGPVEPDQITRDEQIEFLGEVFSANGVQPHWRIIASHYPFRSGTQLEYSARRIMNDYLPIIAELNVDLVVSANDRFQQILNFPGEPMHISTNGGGRKIEKISAVNLPDRVVVSQRGFALISVERDKLLVELFNADGVRTIKRWVQSGD